MRIPTLYLAVYLSAVALLLVLLSVALIAGDGQRAETYRGRRRHNSRSNRPAACGCSPLTCGCPDDGRPVYGCLYCDKTGCAQHRIPPHECLPDRLSQEATADA